MRNLPKVNLFYNTSEDNLVKELYEPCFKWATRYDRGVGYFTSSWFANNIVGMSDFAARGGKMRLITSPIMSSEDIELIINATEEKAVYKMFEKALDNSIEELKSTMQEDALSAFAWLVYDEIIDIRFAVPTRKLKDGMFHDKFGIFYHDDNSLSFTGSLNDSTKGESNYESVKVFKSWTGTKEYVDADASRFERLWNGSDNNLKLYKITEGARDKIFILRKNDRPYQKKENSSKWIHQEKAVEKFLESKNGILAMATGSGKTKTAITIIRKLFENGSIKRAIITMDGNDLLDQWEKQISRDFTDKQIYLHYGNHKDLQKFVNLPDEAILLVSRDADYLLKTFTYLQSMKCLDDTLVLFDEVHGAGSNSMVKGLKGQVSKFKYRLGLSATPEREYDDVGNDFIETEIGPVIFEFTLEEAIEKGILCGFNYYSMDYSLTDEEKLKKRKIIQTFNYKKKNGEAYSETDMWTQLSLVNKTAQNKLPLFKDFIERKPEILDKCIIFVQTKEYGFQVQDLIFDKCSEYHTYFAEDEKTNLEAFANGKLNVLITCKKISEGIDISIVKNIVLFASDKSRLVTTQRIGRALRLDVNDPEKIANVLDFIQEDTNVENNEDSADNLRAEWLSTLAKVREKK
ncbi:MAG: DEAD/DEAH box helicase family protein [Clostridia bacterium]